MDAMSEGQDTEYLRVGQAAARLGVTVRTLHYWESIGLAHASARSPSSYRLYDADDMGRLRSIVTYRALGIDLKSIRDILDNPSANIATLKEQREQLGRKIKQLRTLDTALKKMIDAHEHGLLLSETEQTATFGPQWNPKWPEQARQLYYGTKQWQQYAERSASRDAAGWKAIADAMHNFERSLGEAMDSNTAPGSPEANKLAEQHRELLSAYFPISRQMQICLARMYAADHAYRAHYENIHTGLALWLKRTIEANARTHHTNPDTATWQ